MMTKQLNRLAVCLGLAMSIGGTAASAAEFPSKSIKVIVPYAAGGQGDVNARVIINKVEQLGLLEHPMVVVNMPGGAATIGMREAKNSDADGHTLLYMHQTMMTSELMGTLDFKYTDMKAVAETNNACLASATADGSGITSAQEWVEQAKADPGGVKEATLVGSIAHFTTAMFAQAADIKVGYVNAGGGAKRVASILGNHTKTAVLVPRPIAGNPKLRGLVYFGEERHPTLPDTPTAKELGYEVVSCLNNFWWAPEGTPDDVVATLAGVLETTMQDADLKEELDAKGQSVFFASGQALDERLAGFYAGLSSVADSLK